MISFTFRFDLLEVDVAATDRFQFSPFQRQIGWNSRISVMKLQFIYQQFRIMTNTHTVAVIQVALNSKEIQTIDRSIIKRFRNKSNC